MPYIQLIFCFVSVMNRQKIPNNAVPVFFDLETTGLNTLTCEIIQVKKVQIKTIIQHAYFFLIYKI